jgi:hypothetical protein
MSASASSLLTPVTSPHLHIAGEVCPWCEQPIPHDKFAEISARIADREGEHFAELQAALKEQHAREKEQLEAKAKTELDRARNEVRQEAAAVAQAQLADAARQHEAAEAALRGKLTAAEQAKTTAEAELQAKVDDTQRQVQELRETNEKITRSTAEREAVIRQEAQAAAHSEMQEKFAAAEQAKAAAETQLASSAAEAEQHAQTLRAAHQKEMQEQREALEQANIQAQNAQKAKWFEENLKLSETVSQLQRKLDNKTAEELGDGAEIELYDALKAEFEGDRITRINKGSPGADILHVVIHNGKECGSIIYDSKNRDAWRNDYVNKLVQDQIAAKAEHAILSTNKFPAGARQLHIQDGAIVASPARVAALVKLLRQHIVQGHTMRVSSAERAAKTAALYDFIISERCALLLARIDNQAQEMLDLQVKEKRAHEANWKRQGELYRSVQKARAELSSEIDQIIGTAQEPEQVT